jgi:LacI family transcriptional regulator
VSVNRRPGIKDIAREAGVSPTTVSHVLNRVSDARIATATRERVEKVALELGYAPNGLARALRTQRSQTLALLSDEIATTPYAGKLILGAQEAASDLGWLLLMMSTAGDHQIAEREIAAIWQHQVDGVLYALTSHREVMVPSSLRGKPVFVVNGRASEEQYRSVFPDEVQGGYTATKVLLDAGHIDIGFINTFEDIPAVPGRLAGYRQALEEAGISFRPEYVVEGDGTHTVHGYQAGRKLIEAVTPTAIFCFNDRMAMGAYRAARELGLSIPDQLSVVGFDNQEIIAEALAPALTTLALPYYDMGAIAVTELIGEIEGRPPEYPPHLAVPSPVVERDSVAGPRR